MNSLILGKNEVGPAVFDLERLLIHHWHARSMKIAILMKCTAHSCGQLVASFSIRITARLQLSRSRGFPIGACQHYISDYRMVG
jgi:hypothetical protein